MQIEFSRLGLHPRTHMARVYESEVDTRPLAIH
jgi:hypothetical protein